MIAGWKERDRERKERMEGGKKKRDVEEWKEEIERT